MADENKAEPEVKQEVKVPEHKAKDLAILIKGTDGIAKVKDKKGKEHILKPLDLADLIECEEKKNINILSLGENDRLGLKDVCYLLYLSIRKEGLTEEEVANSNFKITERDVYLMFDLGFIAQSVDVFTELLTISGLEANPKMAVQPADDNAEKTAK